MGHNEALLGKTEHNLSQQNIIEHSGAKLGTMEHNWGTIKNILEHYLTA